MYALLEYESVHLHHCSCMFLRLYRCISACTCCLHEYSLHKTWPWPPLTPSGRQIKHDTRRPGWRLCHSLPNVNIPKFLVPPLFNQLLLSAVVTDLFIHASAFCTLLHRPARQTWRCVLFSFLRFWPHLDGYFPCGLPSCVCAVFLYLPDPQTNRMNGCWKISSRTQC